jgi:plasmid maintenance system antidote protein VapI/DNA-binding response OmpR family regulator
MNQLDKLSIFMLVPDSRSRRVLREVLSAEVYKAEIMPCASPSDLFERLQLVRKADLVFLGLTPGSPELQKFLGSWRDKGLVSKHGLILLLAKQHADFSVRVAESYLQGADGFLKEPYSSQELHALLTAVLEKVRARRLEASAKALKAAAFLMNDAAQLVDMLYSRVAYPTGNPSLHNPKGMDSLKSSLANLQQEFSDEYASALVHTFSVWKIPDAHRAPKPKRSGSTEQISHPGLLALELMNKRSISREKMLDIVKIDAVELDMLLAGERPVTEEIARDLSRALGKTAREWVALQSRWNGEQQGS